MYSQQYGWSESMGVPCRESAVAQACQRLQRRDLKQDQVPDSQFFLLGGGTLASSPCLQGEASVTVKQFVRYLPLCSVNNEKEKKNYRQEQQIHCVDTTTPPSLSHVKNPSSTLLEALVLLTPISEGKKKKKRQMCLSQSC